MKPDVFLSCLASVFLSATGSTALASSFQGVTPAVPGTVIGSNFDIGGPGVSYNLPQSGNGSSTYRADTGAADLKPNTDPTTSNPWVVGFLATGSYLIYSVNISTAGVYNVTARLESGSSGRFHLECDGTALTKSIAVPTTGSWNVATSWTTVNVGQVTLPAGSHKLKLVVDGQYFDLNTLTLVSQSSYTYGPAQAPWYAPVAATTVYIAPRTDGRAGSGTSDDPYDASSSAKYDALVQRFKSNVSIYYATGTYYTEGWKPGQPQTANGNCYHLGAGIDKTIVRLAADSTRWLMFACDYNQRADGFELWNMTLDGNANNNLLFQQKKNVITMINVNGSNILIKQDKFIGFGTAIQGVECFPLFIAPSSYFAGQTLSHVHLENCIFTQPATGNTDGLSVCTVAADPSVNTVDFVTSGCQILNVRSDFTYTHGICGNVCNSNLVDGCDTGWYSEPGSWGGSNKATAPVVLDHNTFKNVRIAVGFTFHPSGQWPPPVTFSNNSVNLINTSNVFSSGFDINGSFGAFPCISSITITGNTYNGMNQQPSDPSYYRATSFSGSGSPGTVVAKLTIQNNKLLSYVPSGREFCVGTKEVAQTTASANTYSNGAAVGVTYSNN